MAVKYTTFLIRQEFDKFGILESQKIIDWKVDDSICFVGDFPAQKLSSNFEYKTVGTFSDNISGFFSYAREKGMIWAVVPPQVQM